MRSSVKTIKFTVFMSFIFLVVTYLITVNMETNWISLNAIWLSNNFFLTVFGGAFASMLVVLICEIQKYLDAKISTEDYIYYQSVYLYGALFIMQQNICDFQNNSTETISEDILEKTIGMVNCEVVDLQKVDYAPFVKKSSFVKAIRRFNDNTSYLWQQIYNGDNAVKMSIYKIKIDRLTMNDPNKIITSNLEPLKSVLEKQLTRVTNVLEIVDNYLQEIDLCCKHRYNWGEKKKSIHSSYVNLFEAFNFDKEYLN